MPQNSIRNFRPVANWGLPLAAIADLKVGFLLLNKKSREMEGKNILWPRKIVGSSEISLKSY